MKKIFTFPENEGTNYFDPNYYGDNTYGMKKRLLDVRGSTYLTQLNPNGPVSMSDNDYLLTRGRMPLYHAETSETGHISQYDLWNNPLLKVRSTFRSKSDWEWINPDFRNMIDGFSGDDAPRFQSTGAHNFDDGANIYLGSLGYPLEWAAGEGYAIAKVIDSTTIELYRHVDYNEDGTPDWTTGDPVPFRPYDIVQGSRLNGVIYDSRPYVIYKEQLNNAWNACVTEAAFRQSAFSVAHATYSDNFKDSEDHVAAPLMVYPRFWDQYTDFSSDELNVGFLSDHWAIVSDRAYTAQSIDNDTKLPGWQNHDDLPDYTIAYEYKVLEDSSDWDGPVEYNNYTIIRKTAHGFKDGDVVNITAVYHLNFVYANDGSTGNARNKFGGRGTEHTYFVERLDDDHFILHFAPYEVRDRVSIGGGGVDSKTMVYFSDSPSTAITGWPGYNNPDLFPASGDRWLSIRKATGVADVRQLWALHIQGYEVSRLDIDHPDYYTKRGFDITHNTHRDSDGLIAVSFRDPLPKYISSAEWAHLGNIQYGYLDSGGNTVRNDAAEVNTKYCYGPTEMFGLGYEVTPDQHIPTRDLNRSGTPTRTMTVVKPTFTIGTDSNGYLENSISFTEGKLPNNLTNNLTFRIQNKEDQYVPPAFTYTEDDWDTADWWTSQDADDDRYWPDHVRPRSAKITVIQPSSVNRSQSGIKYTRGLGVVRYQIELDYPPMTEEDFAPFMGAVQGARGQFRPFYLKLRYKNRKGEEIGLLFQDPVNPNDIIDTVRIRALTDNNRVIEVDGLAPELEKAIKSGQHFGSDSTNRNGRLNTIIQDQRSNVFGESKFRVAYPASGLAVGEKLDLNPSKAVVTLTDDNFEYSTDITGLYTMSVIFELDEFK